MAALTAGHGLCTMLSQMEVGRIEARLSRRLTARWRPVRVRSVGGVRVAFASRVTVAREAMTARSMEVSVTGRCVHMRMTARPVKLCVATMGGVAAHATEKGEERRRQASTEEGGNEHCMHAT